MSFKNLEFPRETIKQTRLGDFLERMHFKYSCLVKNDGDKPAEEGIEGSKPAKEGKSAKESNSAEIKLKETAQIWKKTFVEGQDLKRIKKRQELISDLPVSAFIDENVLIGKGIIEAIFQKIHPGFFIVDPKVYLFFKTFFHEDDKIFIADSVTSDSLKEMISSVKGGPSNFLVGIGGGRVMDYLKYVMMKTDNFCVAIPSSLATHVYASPKIHALPAIAELEEKKTIDGPVPDAAVLDVDFLSDLQKSNPRLIRAGLGDLMASITAIPDWKLAEENGAAKVNHAVIDMADDIIDSLSKLDVEKPLSEWIEDYSFIQVLLCRISGWAGSAPVSGSEHLFALAAEHGFDEAPLHGELVALGTLIMTYIQGGDYEQVSQLMKKLKLPASLNMIGISFDQTVEALFHSKNIGLKKGRFTVLNTLEADRDYYKGVVFELLNNQIIQE